MTKLDGTLAREICWQPPKDGNVFVPHLAKHCSHFAFWAGTDKKILPNNLTAKNPAHAAQIELLLVGISSRTKIYLIIFMTRP